MKNVAKENLMQLKELLGKITTEHYTETTEILSGSSIGQHIRHIIEFYLLLVSGSFSGVISYDKRQRDRQIEESTEFAVETINRLIKGLDTLDLNQPVKLEGDFTKDGSDDNSVASSVGRELAYCIEHSVHHQALIKAGLHGLGLSEPDGENFGVACSTIRYRKNQCAQ